MKTANAFIYFYAVFFIEFLLSLEVPNMRITVLDINAKLSNK